MGYIEKGAAVLAAAEAELKGLASEAVAGDEWVAVAALAGWASGLRSLIDGDPATPVDLAVDSGSTSVEKSKPDAPAPEAPPSKKEPVPKKKETRAPKAARKKAPRASAAKPKRASGKGYPKFVRDGDALVKVGWSKKSRTEYEHRAPRAVLDDIVQAIASLGTNGKRFSVEELLPLLDAEDGPGIPNYQTYLCVAWLREHGLLEQHGRQGYSIADAKRLSKQVDDEWAGTSRRK